MNLVTHKACLRILTTRDGRCKKITRQLNAGYILKTSPVNPHYLSTRNFTLKFFQRTWQPSYAKPPLARRTCALTHPPSGPAMNETTLAISSGCPRRSKGGILLICSIWPSFLPLRNRSVATGPGAMALTQIFLPRSSLARTFTNPSTPAFAAI